MAPNMNRKIVILCLQLESIIYRINIVKFETIEQLKVFMDMFITIKSEGEGKVNYQDVKILALV